MRWCSGLFVILLSFTCAGCAEESENDPISTGDVTVGYTDVYTDGGCDCRDGFMEASASVTLGLRADTRGMYTVDVLDGRAYTVGDPGATQSIGEGWTSSVELRPDADGEITWEFRYLNGWPGSFSERPEWVLEFDLRVTDESGSSVDLSVQTAPFSVNFGAVG